MQVGEPFSFLEDMMNPEILPECVKTPADLERFISGPQSTLSPPARKLMRKLVKALTGIAKHKADFTAASEELHAIGYAHIPEILGITGCYRYGQEGGMFTLSVPRLLSFSTMPIIPPDPEPRIRKAEKQRFQKSVVDRLGYTPEAWECFYCHKVGDHEMGPDQRRWHVDHFYPRVNGGDSHKDNKVLACATCNLSKGAKSAVDFAASRGEMTCK